MLVIGVDPGATGCFAVYDSDGPALSCFPMPNHHVMVGKTKRLRVDLHGTLALGRALCANGPAFSVLEDVQGFGKQNAAAAFVFGRATCAAEMALIAASVAIRYVRPERWKKELGISPEKENAVLEAKRLFPRHAHEFEWGRGLRTKEQAIGNAEAGLIAYYGATKLCQPSSS